MDWHNILLLKLQHYIVLKVQRRHKCLTVFELKSPANSMLWTDTNAHLGGRWREKPAKMDVHIVSTGTNNGKIILENTAIQPDDVFNFQATYFNVDRMHSIPIFIPILLTTSNQFGVV